MAEATDVRMCPFRTDFCSRDRCKARRMRNDNNNKYNNRTKSIHLASSSIFSFNGLFLAFLRVSNGAAHKLKIPCDYYFWLCRVAFQQFVILLWIIIVRKFSNFFFCCFLMAFGWHEWLLRNEQFRSIFWLALRRRFCLFDGCVIQPETQSEACRAECSWFVNSIRDEQLINPFSIPIIFPWTTGTRWWSLIIFWQNVLCRKPVASFDCKSSFCIAIGKLCLLINGCLIEYFLHIHLRSDTSQFETAPGTHCQNNVEMHDILLFICKRRPTV